MQSLTNYAKALFDGSSRQSSELPDRPETQNPKGQRQLRVYIGQKRDGKVREKCSLLAPLNHADTIGTNDRRG